VISVGRNDYGHPAPETLGRLARHRVPVYRTDRDGTVEITTDGRRMSVRSSRGVERFAVAGDRTGDSLSSSGAACRLP